MKIIRYKILETKNIGTEDEPILVEKISPKGIQYSKGNMEIAKAEAYNGEVTVEEVPDNETEPTSADLETRVATVETDLADLTAAVEKGLSL